MQYEKTFCEARVKLERSSNLADKPSSANGLLGTRAEMTCMTLHKTWQMNLLWPMDPQLPTLQVPDER